MEIKDDIKAWFKYFAPFFALIILFESVTRIIVFGEITFDGLQFLFFVPAMASTLSLFTGFHKKKPVPNSVIFLLITLILSIYYISQIIYFNNFGSLYSISLVKMGGEALDNFGWALKATLRSSALIIILMLVPIAALTITIIIKKNAMAGFSLHLRAMVLAMTVSLWLLSVLALMSFGTGRTSAYHALTDPYTDTDTSAEKIGVLMTSIVESGAYFFGAGSNTEAKLESADLSAYMSLSGDNGPVQNGLEDVPGSGSDTGGYKDISGSEAYDNDISSAASAENPDEETKYHKDDRIDIDALRAGTDNDDIAALCDYFNEKEALPFNDHTGLLKDHNLIYICGESFGPYALNEKVTPLLSKMAGEGIVSPNYYTSYKNTTTNGEFAFLTGLWPDVSRYAADGNAVGSFARSYDKYMPYGLGTLFKNEGIPSFAYHGYISSYYRRGDSWPNLGFETIKFMNEGMTFKNYWSPSDLELMEQSVDDYINEDRFVAYYMTYSGHGDYTTDTYMYLKNNAAVRELLGDDAKNYSDSEISFFCGNYELELSLEYLTDRLKAADKSDNTLIVIACDHVPYYFTPDEMKDMAKKSGMDYDRDFEMYRSTLIMYTPALNEVNESFCCNTDVLPTVLNLLDIDYDSRFIMGMDVFAKGIHRARLYNGNFITEYVKYNASKGKAVWSEKGETLTDWQKEIYLENMIKYTEAEYAASIKLMDNDFYRELFPEE